MSYEVEVSFNNTVLGDSSWAGEIAISKLPWVVTAGGDLGEKLAAMPVGSIGFLDETMGSRTTKHQVRVKSVERLSSGAVRAVYEPVDPAILAEPAKA